MNFLFDVVKGALIGVANIIPGVSGGTMMVSMGVYEKIIGVVNNLFKDIKKSILTLLPTFFISSACTLPPSLDTESP